MGSATDIQQAEISNSESEPSAATPSSMPANHQQLSAHRVCSALAITLALAWFSGPYVSIAARQIYEYLFYSYYQHHYAWYDPRGAWQYGNYVAVYLPGQEHVANLAYQWGPYRTFCISIPG